MKYKLELITLFDKPMLYIEERMKDVVLPKGLYKYEAREDDSANGDMVEIKDSVAVNFLATIISAEKIDTIVVRGEEFSIEQGIPVTSNDYGYEGDFYTIDEYKEKYAGTMLRPELQACTTACHLVATLNSIYDDDFKEKLLDCISKQDAFALGEMAAKYISKEED